MTLKAQCEHYGMPLMVEPLVMKDASTGGYTSDGELEKVVPLVRQAIELGADVIKADPTDIAADYHHVIQTAGSVPVLVRGGGRVSDEELVKSHRRSTETRRSRNCLWPKYYCSSKTSKDDASAYGYVA
jgi:fructose-bisphosphate aldolase, class I